MQLPTPTVLLRATALTLATGALGAAPLYAQCGPLDDQKLGASAPLPNALYGFALDVSGTRAIVGAQNEGPNGTGAVYFLVHSGGQWSEEQRLQQGPLFGQFGYTVAISGDTAAVSSSSGVDRVQVLRRGASQWAQEQELSAFGTGNPGWFARALDIDGDVLVAGSSNAASSVTNNTGRGWVWRRTGTTWSQEAELIAPDAVAGDAFGTSVGLSGDWAACGSPENTNARGATYVFHFDGTTWQFVVKLQPLDLSTTARFGHSLALDGDTLAVGAYTNAGSGSVYLFRLIGGQWQQEAKLMPSGPGQHGYGEQVALSGNELLIRDHFGNTVERWSRMGGSWVPLGRLFAANVYSNYAYFGRDLALSGSLALIGDYEDDELGDRAGAAFAYDLANYQGVCSYCTAQTNSQGCAASISTSGTPSATAGSGFVISTSNLVPGQVGRFIYSTQLGYSFTALGGGGTICVDDPKRNTPLLATGGAAACSGTLAFDFNSWIATGNDPALAFGAVVRGQFWSRDLGTPPRNVSDAVTFVVLP